MLSIELIIALIYFIVCLRLYYVTYFTTRFSRSVVAKEIAIYLYTLPWMYLLEWIFLQNATYSKRQKFKAPEKYLYLVFGSLNAFILFLIGKAIHALYNIISFS